MRGLGTGLGMALCVVLGANAALAQIPSTAEFGDSPAPASSGAASSGAASSGAAPSAPAPDIVRLKNGGLLRGQIGELVPGGTVTIVTITGSTRVFDMADVVYAGPTAQEPQTAPLPIPEPEHAGDAQNRPYVTVHAPEARVRFRSAEKGITFYRHAASTYSEGRYISGYSKGYEVICVAPCEASMPSGKEMIAFGRGDVEPIDLRWVTFPPGDSQLRLNFVKHPVRRTVGSVLVVVGPVLAFASFLALVDMPCFRGERLCSDAETNRTWALVGVGVGGLGVGLGVGIPLLAKGKDAPVLETLPVDSAARRLQQAQGLTLSGKF